MAYVAPTSDDLKDRYPAFSGVSADTISLWLAEAVTESSGLPDDVRARAEMAYAAHRMAELGVNTGGVSISGVTAFRSGDFSASIGDVAAARVGYDSSIYGREFVMLRRRYFGGPTLIGCSDVC